MKKSDIEALKKIIKAIRHGIGDIRKGNIQGAETGDYLTASKQAVCDFRRLQQDIYDKMPAKTKRGYAGDEAEEELATLDDVIAYFDNTIEEYPRNPDLDWLMDNLDEIAEILEELTEEL